MGESADARIARLRSACGCRESFLAMAAAVGAYTGYAVLFDPLSLSLLHRILVGFGVGLAAAVIGKLAAILWARHQLTHLLGQRA